MIHNCLFYCFKDDDNLWEIIQGVSNLLSSLLTLALAFYVFIYQRNKDKVDKAEALITQRKTVKLEWFKEIIIQPKINEVFTFFEKINSIKEDIDSNDLSSDERQRLIDSIKSYQSDLRKSFLEIIQNINTDLYNNLLNHVDVLTDQLTEIFSNDELKLCNERTYEREVQKRIDEAYNNFMSSIFNFAG